MKNTDGFPGYVKLGLIGIHSRKGALVQFWLAVGICIVLLRFVLNSNSFVWTMVYCIFALLTAKWYWSCIRWVDEHARWDK